MSLRRRANASRNAAPTASVNSQSSGSGHRRSVAGVFKEKMEDDMLELPLLPLKEGELEARLNEMDTTQVKFMIPRIALRSQVSGSVTPAISESEDDALDSEDLAMVRPNAEVIREIREIKKLQFRCGVAIVLVMIVGVLVLACGIGFIIFHAAKFNRQIETGVQKLEAAKKLLENHAKPLLGHVKNTLDEGIGHIDILVNTQMETIMRVLDGDSGVEEYPNGVADVGLAKLGQRIIGGTKIGVAVTNNSKRSNSDEQATSVVGTTGSCAAGCLGTACSIGKGICQNILSCGGACDSEKEGP